MGAVRRGGHGLALLVLTVTFAMRMEEKESSRSACKMDKRGVLGGGGQRALRWLTDTTRIWAVVEHHAFRLRVVYTTKRLPTDWTRESG